jgi:N-acetylglucosamine-6-phosphate deacetylase
VPVAKIIINGKVLGPQGLLPEGTAVWIHDGKIEHCSPPPMDMSSLTQVVDARGLYVSPGFIDTHLHGALGYEFLEGTPEAVQAITSHLYATGVTGFLPNSSTLAPDDILRGMETLAGLTKTVPGMLGVHMEGPFVSYKYKGSQREDYIQAPQGQFMQEVLAAGKGCIRLVTLAPELPGALALVEELTAQGIVVSAGHTAANFQEFTQAYRKGLTHVTHMFNAMTGVHHRDLGVAGGALLYDDIYCELILDGIHVSPGAAKLLKRIKSVDKIALVTDSSRFTGLPDGEYARFDGQKVQVRDNSVRVSSGSLAGSMLDMAQAVKNATTLMDCTLSEAVHMASSVPAKILGLGTKGSIAPGMDADIVIFDGELNIKYTIINGDIVYRGA